MHTIELTDDEVALLRTALQTLLDDFGHEQEDMLRRIAALQAKLDAA